MELKAQQMIQRMLPDGYFINVDALSEIEVIDPILVDKNGNEKPLN